MAASRNITRLIENNRLRKIQSVLESFSLEQRRSIVSKKFKQKSLFYTAVESNQIALVKYLLDECGASIKDSGSCLCKAASNKSLELVQLLVKHGSDVNEVDSKRSSALYFACLRGDMVMVAFLVNNGAQVDDANLGHFTPLMMSVQYPEICKFLLVNGADPKRVNSHKKTALMMAVEKESSHGSVEILLSFGADVNFTNIHGENAVFLASREGFTQMVELLQSYGAKSATALARCYQIKSCIAALQHNQNDAQLYWKMYMGILDLPQTTPMFLIDSPDYKNCVFEPILDIFDSNCQKVILYLERHFGLYNPYTLQALASSVWATDSIKSGVRLFTFFLEILASSKNVVFFRTMPDINNIYTQLHLTLTLNKTQNNLEIMQNKLKLYANYVEGIGDRVKKMDKRKKALVSVRIDSVFCIVATLLKTILKMTPGDTSALKESTERIVSADLRGSNHDTLLHFCIKRNYSMDICKVLLLCKAEINCRNRQRFTPVHYALSNSQFQQREIIQHFLSYGLLFNAWNDEEFCLACTLKEREILPQPAKNTTLQCLAASAIAKNALLNKYEVPRHLQDLVALHS